MTKPEFLAGYSLLTIQPWGKLYRGNGPEATIQAELYYRNVNRANHIIWQEVCESAASGERWPSISDLKAALQAKDGYRINGQRRLTHAPVYTTCPPEVAEKLEKLGVKL